jgi:prepilin-type N-terminal cleavage/methylation domain-containing protein/prepilin-type processing-associated H-X9-DG protein
MGPRFFWIIVKIDIMQKRHKQGFTLIELLVVIAIIALLLSVLMPSLQKVKEQARAVIDRANQHQWGIMYSLYAEDNKQSLPVGWNGGTMWMVDFLVYSDGENEIFLCPSAKKFLSKKQDIWVAGEFTAWGIYGDGAYPVPNWGKEGQYGSYGINAWTHNPLDIGVPGTYDTPEEMRSRYWRKVTKASRAETIPLLGGCMWDGAGPSEYDAPPENQGVQEPGSNMSIFCLDRHNGGPNMLFMDTSARKIGLRELWTLKWHREYDTRGIYTKAGGATRESWPEWMRGYEDY